MKKAILILWLSLVTISAQVPSSQTRPRRAGETTPTPSPSPGSPETKPDKVNVESMPSPPAIVSSEGGQDLDVVRIDTNLVTVPLSVVDRDGRYISDLQKEDFQIAEDGVEQEIAYFGTVEKPFTVVLMLDTSASTWSKLGQIKDAAEVFVEQLRPDDQVMVISFGMGVKVQCEPTNDRRKIRKAIGATGRGLSTHLYDAMENVMKKHLGRIQGRKALVVFTDGVDATSNHATYESTVRTAEELDALIYPILYDTYDPSIDTGGPTAPQSNSGVISILRKIPLPLPIPTIGTGGSSGGGGAGSSRADYDRGERYLHELADLTGGRVYEASRDLRYLRDAFSKIADELGRQYSIGYYPKRKGEPGERRQIKVRVRRPDLAVRAREKYIYKGPTGQLPKTATTEENKQTQSPPVLQKKPFIGNLKTPQ
jgi:Ca-activated chloride channel family protein